MSRSIPAHLFIALSALSFGVSLWGATVLRHAPIEGLGGGETAYDGAASSLRAPAGLTGSTGNAFATLALRWGEASDIRERVGVETFERRHELAAR